MIAELLKACVSMLKKFIVRKIVWNFQNWILLAGSKIKLKEIIVSQY